MIPLSRECVFALLVRQYTSSLPLCRPAATSVILLARQAADPVMHRRLCAFALQWYTVAEIVAESLQSEQHAPR
jgi:hypothetical protein